MTERDHEASELPGVLSEFSEIVGTDGALLLAKRFGGQRIYIPTYDGRLRVSRNCMIREDHKSGVSFAQLSVRYSLTIRQLENIVYGQK